jgi:signal transduction histidine kinase/HAMP domain-containing protein
MTQIDFWIPWGRWAFLSPKASEYPLLALFLLVAAFLLVRSRLDFARLTWRRLGLFLLLLASAAVANNLVVVRSRALIPLSLPYVPAEPAYPFAPLLAVVPIALAGAWLGAAPALLVGLAVGFTRALVVTSGMLDPFYFALLGYIGGALLRQSYPGAGPATARLPLVALVLAAVIPLPVIWIAALAHTLSSGLAGLDYATSLLGAAALPSLAQAVCAAVLLHAVYAIFPHLRAVRTVAGHPPYDRAVLGRSLLVSLPIMALFSIGLGYASLRIALDSVARSTVGELARDAAQAAAGMAEFARTGQQLLSVASAGPALTDSQDPLALEQALQASLRSTAFFSQLGVYGADGLLLASYPPAAAGGAQPADVTELPLLARVAQSGAPQVSAAHRSQQGDVVVTFLAPVAGAGSRVLVGQARLDANPITADALARLQAAREGAEGFVVDADGTVTMHPRPEMLLSSWSSGRSGRSDIAAPYGSIAYATRNPASNTRELVVFRASDGSPWTAVIRLPYRAILQDALGVAGPFLLAQLLLCALWLLVITTARRRLTASLQAMTEAAKNVAEGDFSRAVRVPGADELAGLAQALDQLRLRVRDRLEDLALLLQVSQAASSTLDLSQGLTSILEGALRASSARVSRLVMLTADGLPDAVLARGVPQEGLAGLDRTLVAAVREGGAPVVAGPEEPDALVVRDLRRGGALESAAAAPVCIGTQMAAVLWLGYGDASAARESDLALLSALAGQAAALLGNARLFVAAEDERRRLAAILECAGDGAVVTDPQGRIEWMNPAAERALGVAAGQWRGKALSNVEPAGVFGPLLASPMPDERAETRALPLPGGGNLQAMIAPVAAPDGAHLGHITLLRDVTLLTHAVAGQSDYVAKVLHDLRSPLTYVRGYAAMLPMVGEINARQQEHLDKILNGVDLMTSLTGGLIDLDRIALGNDVFRKPCYLSPLLVEVVDGLRERALAQGLALRLEPAEKMVLVNADAALLRQALLALLDNALTYTPRGGVVTVGTAIDGDRAVVRVADTGIGLAPEDLERVFERFYRVRRRDTAQVPGAGLGLTLVRAIVGRHAGKVWVESELGRGSTFYVALPLSGRSLHSSGAAGMGVE